jgi:AcrR family transcriptional regulator
MDGAEARTELDGFCERVLERFTQRAQEVGIRRVKMGDLAADLRVSKRTIYEAFPSKEALVRAFTEAWMARIQERVAFRRTGGATGMELLRSWAEAWSRGNGRISTVLWADIRAHYPDIYAEFRSQQRAQMQDTTDSMRALMRPDIDADVAIAVFEAIRGMAQNERVRQRLGLEMEDLLVKAVEVWARGAYRDPDVKPPSSRRGW